VRHNVYGKHLGRDKNQRTALFRGLIRSLILQGYIVSTEAKIKSIKGLVDKLFVKAKKGDQASLNVLTRTIFQADVTKKIIELAKGFKTKNSGFTETVRLGMRQGDGSMMMRMSLINESSVVSRQPSDVKEEKIVEKKEEVESKEEITKPEKKEKKTRRVKK